MGQSGGKGKTENNLTKIVESNASLKYTRQTVHLSTNEKLIWDFEINKTRTKYFEEEATLLVTALKHGQFM